MMKTWRKSRALSKNCGITWAKSNSNSGIKQSATRIASTDTSWRSRSTWCAGPVNRRTSSSHRSVLGSSGSGQKRSRNWWANWRTRRTKRRSNRRSFPGSCSSGSTSTTQSGTDCSKSCQNSIASVVYPWFPLSRMEWCQGPFWQTTAESLSSSKRPDTPVSPVLTISSPMTSNWENNNHYRNNHPRKPVIRTRNSSCFWVARTWAVSPPRFALPA